ncbi:MAG TPA: NUDIX hydrolase [Acidobacteriota bacterium]|nr:NUDIX hydrolase [Acidobacteriota bacterium]
MTIQKNAYVDVNPVIVTSDQKIVLAKRIQGIVGGGKWHLPGGRVQYKETLEATLKRIAYTKTNLKIKLFYPSLKESLVGIYDNPERDPREHVISIAFLCNITEGKTKPGTKVEAVNSFSEAETKNLEIAFDHRKTVENAFSILKKNGSTTKDEHLNATQI